MADDSATSVSTPISPEDAAKLWAKRTTTSRSLSSDEAAKLWATKKPSGPSAGQLAKMTGQNLAVQGSGMAPIVAGAYLGGELGAAGGPFAEVTVPIGAMAGAGLGAMTSPTARYYMGKLVGSEQPSPTVPEANYEGKIAALTEMFGPIASRWSAKAVDTMYGALVGRSELAQVGTEAGQAAEQAGVIQKQQLQTAAAKEATKQKTSAAQAAETTGRANLAERGQAAQTAQQISQQFPQTQTAAQAKANADFEQTANKLREQIVPEAREETVTGALGKTPEQTRQTRFDPNAPQHQAEQRDVINQKVNEARGEYGKEYEVARGQLGGKPINMTNTATVAQQLEDKARANNWALDASTRRLLVESKAMGQPAGQFDPRKMGIPLKVWAKKSPEEQEGYIRAAGKMKDVTGGVGGVPAFERPKIAQAIGLNSKWGAQLGGSESYDGLVARQMREAVLKDLDGANVPRLKELNNRYRAFLNGGLGDYDFIGRVAQPKGGELHNEAAQIFGNPQRGMDFARRLSPEDKPLFRDMYADYIHTGGKISPDHALILAEMGFKGPLTKPESWVYADKQATNLDEIFATAPNARAKLQQQIDMAKADSEGKFNEEVIKEGYKSAKALGMAGDRIKAKMDAAKTPQQKADIAIQAFNNLDPGQVAADIQKGQRTPGMAAYQASIQAPRIARQAAQGFQPPDPSAAAAKAIQEFQPQRGRWSGYLLRRSAYQGIGGGGYGVMSGKTPAGLAESAVVVPAVLGRDAIARAWRSSIQESPEAALTFLRGMQNAGTPKGLRTLADSLVDSAIAQHISQRRQKPQTPEPSPTPKSVGPMVKHIEEKKAENIAGPRGALSPTRISTIQDTSKQIAAGSAPDIQADLRNGRMSHSDVAQMLKPDKPGLAALFQGLTPQQAVDAFAHADPQEREMTLPALAQHIQETGKTLKPQERQAMLAQLKAVMAPQQSEGEEA